MKILIVANGYPTPQDPQWGCFEWDQALALERLGQDVAVLVVDTRFRNHRRKRGISCFRTQNVPVYLGFWFPLRVIELISGTLRDKITCRLYDKVYSRLVEDFGTPDLIYAHFQRNIFFSVYLKDKYDVPLVGIEHWSALMQDHLPAFAQKRGRESYPSVDRLLAVSKVLSTSIKNKFGVDSDVVYDMLGPEFLGFPPTGCPEREGFRFIAVGSLLPIKGYDILIRAFSESGLRDKGCSVRIIGDGPERQGLERIIEECRLGDSVELPGRMGKEEIARVLRESDVFVLSSRSETFGVACIEALSQGVPCIATRCGGPEEIVTEKDGVMIASEDQEELRRALCFMYENHCQYDREDISARCLSRFSPQVIAAQLSRIFKEVVDNHNKKL